MTADLEFCIWYKEFLQGNNHSDSVGPRQGSMDSPNDKDRAMKQAHRYMNTGSMSKVTRAEQQSIWFPTNGAESIG